MSAPSSPLSAGLFICRSWTSLGYSFCALGIAILCLEALSATVSLRGTGRHAVYFSNSQTLLTFGHWIIHLLTRLRVSKIMPINPSYWPARLLRPTWVICGAWWRTLLSASHIKNIIWAKFKADLLSEKMKMSATTMYILQYVCCSFQSAEIWVESF